MKDMMQEYNNNDQISEDTTANDVGLNTENYDNNGELTTINSANNGGYNLRRNKRDYGKHI